MVGIGETIPEIFETIKDLRDSGVELLTIGQYLQPTPKHVPISRFVAPQEFESFKKFGYDIGFRHVESGPLVRSSYHAASQAQAASMSNR
jgi:lipoic acid synthetase